MKIGFDPFTDEIGFDIKRILDNFVEEPKEKCKFTCYSKPVSQL